MVVDFLGSGQPILKPQAVRSIPADRRIKTGVGKINTNPARKDCIVWEDKNGNLIYRTDYEKQQYEEYLKENNDEVISLEEFTKELWL